MRLPDCLLGQRAEMVEDVASLPVIPPLQVVGFDADLLERGLGLLDLNLGTAMRQHKRDVAVKEDLHTRLDRPTLTEPPARSTRMLADASQPPATCRPVDSRQLEVPRPLPSAHLAGGSGAGGTGGSTV